jgi:hypothetical protein
MDLINDGLLLYMVICLNQVGFHVHSNVVENLDKLHQHTVFRPLISW